MKTERFIPDGWRDVELGTFAQIYQPQTISKEFFTEEGYPVFGANGEIGFYNKYNHEFEQILISCRGSNCGTVNYSPKYSWINGNAMVVNLDKTDYNKRFFYYLLLNTDLTIFITGSAQPQIIRTPIEKLKVTFPISLDEQSLIVAILSAADEAIEQTQRLIEKYRSIKVGLLHDLLTKGIDEKGNIRSIKTHKFKDSPLGLIPEEWECTTIGEIADFIGSGVTPKGGSEVYLKEGIMLIRSQNVYPNSFKLDDVAYISDEINSRMKRSELKELDVLLNITGASIGRCTYVPYGFPKANVNQHVCAIRMKKPNEHKSIFVSAFLNSDFGQRQIMQLNAGSNRQGLNYDQIRALYIPDFRNEKELDNFSVCFTNIECQIQALETSLVKLQQQKAGLMQDLLTGYVRVNKLINNK